MVEWKIFGMEWKKIASMEYGKIVFLSIPCPDYCSLMLIQLGLPYILSAISITGTRLLGISRLTTKLVKYR